MKVWILEDEDYNNTIYSVRMTYEFNLETGESSGGVDTSSTWDDGGDMAFGTKKDIPDLEEPFTMITKSSDHVTIYDGCEFNETNFMNNYKDNTIMSNIPRTEDTEVSISFERKKQISLEEYRDSVIDELVG